MIIIEWDAIRMFIEVAHNQERKYKYAVSVVVIWMIFCWYEIFADIATFYILLLNLVSTWTSMSIQYNTFCIKIIDASGAYFKFLRFLKQVRNINILKEEIEYKKAWISCVTKNNVEYLCYSCFLIM